jgi:hypothetical protein
MEHALSVGVVMGRGKTPRFNAMVDRIGQGIRESECVKGRFVSKLFGVVTARFRNLVKAG